MPIADGIASRPRRLPNTRLFLPTNFHQARAQGLEASLVLREPERVGLGGRLQ